MPSDLLEIVLLAMAAGVIAVDLSLGVIRGRFGSPQRRANLELIGLAGSRAVPKSARRRARAMCHGHTADELPVVLGAGVLWLEDDRLGFLVRRPRRRMEIDLTVVQRAYVSHFYKRTGFPPVRSKTPMLVVEWSTTKGTAVIAWQIENAAAWVDQMEGRPEPAEIIAPYSSNVRVA
jgi:hypothetical protein